MREETGKFKFYHIDAMVLSYSIAIDKEFINISAEVMDLTEGMAGLGLVVTGYVISVVNFVPVLDIFVGKLDRKLEFELFVPQQQLDHEWLESDCSVIRLQLFNLFPKAIVFDLLFEIEESEMKSIKKGFVIQQEVLGEQGNRNSSTLIDNIRTLFD